MLNSYPIKTRSGRTVVEPRTYVCEFDGGLIFVDADADYYDRVGCTRCDRFYHVDYLIRAGLTEDEFCQRVSRISAILRKSQHETAS